MTYPLLALGVIIFPCLLDTWLRTGFLRDTRFWAVLAALLVCTLIFNSILTGLPIVTYDPSSLLGIHVGTIPIEDFSYTFAAALLPRIILKSYERR